MQDYDPKMSFADDTAARNHDIRGDEAECIAYLRRCAGGQGGRTLELAVGTGRIAIPLAEQGVSVDGIDFSDAMLARLRGKPGGAGVATCLGDFVEIGFDGPYDLIFIVWNSFFNVLEQRAQVRCFANAAKRLESGGKFLIEAFTPNFLFELSDGQRLVVEDVQPDRVRLGALTHDPAKQTLAQNHVSLSASGARFDPVMQRYAWPAELDLMADMAGLTLLERWGGWEAEPFTADSKRHVSVWVKP